MVSKNSQLLIQSVHCFNKVFQMPLRKSVLKLQPLMGNTASLSPSNLANVISSLTHKFFHLFCTLQYTLKSQMSLTRQVQHVPTEAFSQHDTIRLQRTGTSISERQVYITLRWHLALSFPNFLVKEKKKWSCLTGEDVGWGRCEGAILFVNIMAVLKSEGA